MERIATTNRLSRVRAYVSERNGRLLSRAGDIHSYWMGFDRCRSSLGEDNVMAPRFMTTIANPDCAFVETAQVIGIHIATIPPLITLASSVLSNSWRLLYLG